MVYKCIILIYIIIMHVSESNRWWFLAITPFPKNFRLISKYCLCIHPHDGASRCPWKRTRGDGRCTLVSRCVIVNPKRPPITTTLLRVISTAFDDSARPAIGTTEPKPTTAADEGARFADRVLSQLVFVFLCSKRHGVRYSQSYPIILFYIFLLHCTWYTYTHITNNTTI